MKLNAYLTNGNLFNILYYMPIKAVCYDYLDNSAYIDSPKLRKSGNGLIFENKSNSFTMNHMEYFTNVDFMNGGVLFNSTNEELFMIYTDEWEAVKSKLIEYGYLNN